MKLSFERTSSSDVKLKTLRKNIPLEVRLIGVGKRVPEKGCRNRAREKPFVKLIQESFIQVLSYFRKEFFTTWLNVRKGYSQTISVNVESETQ